MMYVNCEDDLQLSRVTGFRFTNSNNPTSGGINVRGRGLGPTGLGAFRIDNNLFENFQFGFADLEGVITIGGRGSGTYTNGRLNGLIDNNTFHNTGYTDGYVIIVQEPWQFGGSGFAYSGGNAWIPSGREFAFGSSDAVFIEDNIFNNDSQYARHYIVGIRGSKYVFRYNTCDADQDNGGTQMDQVDAHGHCICSSIGHGARGGEIYGNTFDGTEVGRHVVLRGGQWLVYDNTYTAASVGTPIWLSEYRARVSGGCTSTCASDPSWAANTNDGGASWRNSEQIGADFEENEALSYFWNNLKSSTHQSPFVHNDGSVRDYIQSGRDFVDDTSQPSGISSYTAYDYPHPLRQQGILSTTTVLYSIC